MKLSRIATSAWVSSLLVGVYAKGGTRGVERKLPSDEEKQFWEELFYKNGGGNEMSTFSPTSSPTASPTSAPTRSPTAQPTISPTSSPTETPTEPPTEQPTSSPTVSPTANPTRAPTNVPTSEPTGSPSSAPTPDVFVPTLLPTTQPTRQPTAPDGLCEFIDGNLGAAGDFGVGGLSMVGRINRTAEISVCGSQKVYPSDIATLPRIYDSFGPFTNPLSTDVCATIVWDIGDCIDSASRPLAHPTAYEIFDPENRAAGFLGDVGPVENTVFSFDLDEGDSFFLIIQQVQSGSRGLGCNYRFLIDLENCETTTDTPTLSPVEVPVTASPTSSPTSEPTSSPVEETQPPTLPPNNGSTQSPVIQTDSPTLPPNDATNQPTRSPTNSPTVTPTSNPTSSPVDFPTTNPPTRNPTQLPTTSPTVSQTDSPTVSPMAEPTSSPVTITDLPTRSPTFSPVAPTDPPTLTPTPVGTCQRISSPPLGSSETTTFSRIGGSFEPSTCESSEYPGSFGTTERFYEELGPFVNPSSNPSCVTINYYPGDCVSSGNTLVHATAFTSFDPNDIAANYLGDVGSRDEFFVFEFTLAGDAEFFFVGQQVLDIAADNNGVGCVFSIEIGFDEVCPYVP